MSETSEIQRIKAQIENVYAEVCRSFGQLNLDSVLNYFSDLDDMVKISNGTVLHGKKELSEYWHGRLDDVDSLRISIENVDVHIIDENHVWTTADEYIILDERSQKAIVSNIFILTAEGWKILLDHTTYVQ